MVGFVYGFGFLFWFCFRLQINRANFMQLVSSTVLDFVYCFGFRLIAWISSNSVNFTAGFLLFEF